MAEFFVLPPSKRVLSHSGDGLIFAFGPQDFETRRPVRDDLLPVS